MRQAVGWLVGQGVPFTPDDDGPLGLHLTREAGMPCAASPTRPTPRARPSTTALLAAARPPEHPAARALDGGDLVTSSHLQRDEPRASTASTRSTSTPSTSRPCRRAVVLATSGAGKVYRYTTNPDTSTGDGIAMAWRAGCRVANMEFIQFHPTCLYHPQERSFLITEGAAGRGRVSQTSGWHPLHGRARRALELAPRDIVARAIDFEMKKHGLDHVWLDATHLGEAFLIEHFPTIHARCLKLGIDIARQPIPGGAGGAFHLRRRGDRPQRPLRPAGPLRRGRDRLHRPARRQPPGQQFAAGCVVLGQTSPISCSVRLRPRRCPAGTRARSRTPTSRSSSRTTGTSCAC